MNVTELLTTIKTLTKQTKNTSKITNLRAGLKTADHCGVVCRAGGNRQPGFRRGAVEQTPKPKAKETRKHTNSGAKENEEAKNQTTKQTKKQRRRKRKGRRKTRREEARKEEGGRRKEEEVGSRK